MTALVPIKCRVVFGGSLCGGNANRMIFMGNKVYGVCDEHFDWFKRIRQLIIKT